PSSVPLRVRASNAPGVISSCPKSNLTVSTIACFAPIEPRFFRAFPVFFFFAVLCWPTDCGGSESGLLAVLVRLQNPVLNLLFDSFKPLFLRFVILRASGKNGCQPIVCLLHVIHIFIARLSCL